MSVLVQNVRTSETLVFVKGAPEKLQANSLNVNGA